MRKITIALALCSAALVSTPALADPAAAEVCTATTFSSLAAIDCKGAFIGNINGSASELADLNGWWGPGFTYAGKSDDAGSGPFISNPLTSGPGTLTFDNPISGKFVIGLKAASNYSYYLFNASSPITSLTFDTTAGVALNRNGIAQELSHAALYPVPEPETYAMLMAGLGLLGFVARRRKANAA